MLGIGELGRGGAVQGLRALGVLVIILSRKTHHLKKKNTIRFGTLESLNLPGV